MPAYFAGQHTFFISYFHKVLSKKKKKKKKKKILCDKNVPAKSFALEQLLTSGRMFLFSYEPAHDKTYYKTCVTS